MRIDLHVHTAERSGCARAGAVAQFAAAHEAGLGAIAVTDHHALVPAGERDRLQALFPDVLLLPGIEITLDDYEDILVIGVDHPDLVRCHWDWPDLHAFGREHDALLVLAHPFRYLPVIGIDLDTHPPDAIELCSTNIDPADHARIREVAGRLGIPLVANSDAHTTAPLGAYANRLHTAAATPAAILDAIRSGGFTMEAPDVDH